MSSYYFTNSDQGPPSSGVDGGKNCEDGNNWVCEHRWKGIANMVQWRNIAGTSEVDNWTNGNSNQIAFSRGDSAFIAMNRDSQEWSFTASTSLSNGTYCNVLYDNDSDDTSSCSNVVNVDSDGKAEITVPALYAIAIHNAAKK